MKRRHFSTPIFSPTAEPELTPQYTLTVTAGEGGTLSTEGGTYDEGTKLYNPNDGYEFIDGR